MKEQYEDRRRYADAFLPHQQFLLSRFFTCSPDDIQISSHFQDTQEATDLIAPGSIHVAARVRRPEHYTRFAGQFTIRAREWEKVLARKVRYSLYGFAHPTYPTKVGAWWLLDLETVVRAHEDGYACTRMPQTLYADGTEFLAFDLDGFLSVPPLVVMTNQPRPGNTDGTCDFCRRKAAAARVFARPS